MNLKSGQTLEYICGIELLIIICVINCNYCRIRELVPIYQFRNECITQIKFPTKVSLILRKLEKKLIFIY